jgi:hypothetical protein
LQLQLQLETKKKKKNWTKRMVEKRMCVCGITLASQSNFITSELLNNRNEKIGSSSDAKLTTAN